MYRGKDTQKVKSAILLETSGKVLVILDIFGVEIYVFPLHLSVHVVAGVEMRDITDGKAFHCQFLFLFQVLSLSMNFSLAAMRQLDRELAVLPLIRIQYAGLDFKMIVNFTIYCILKKLLMTVF